MPERVRIHDVADAAGVSVATVSHALSGRGKMSDDTRIRVKAVALQLGYAPNRIASALRRRRSDIVGLVSDEIATTPFAGQIVLGAQQAADTRDMTLMLVNSNRDAALERRQVGALLAQQVDAILYATMSHRPVTAPAVPASVPLVLVNATAAGTEIAAAVPDEVGLAKTATQLLVEAGHTRIAHLTIEDPGFAQQGRLAGYRAAMSAAALTAQVVMAPGEAATAEAGRIAFHRALDEQPGLTAVFCFNDPMAMGVYQAAGDRDFDIPADLSVVGVDDLPIIAAQLRPGLTTLALPHYEMGRWGMEQVITRLDGSPGTRETVLLPSELVVRESVTAPRWR